MPSPWDKEIAEVQRRNAEKKAQVKEGMRQSFIEEGRKRTWGQRRLTVGMLLVNDALLVIAGAALGAWLW